MNRSPRVHTPEERLQARREGERRAQMALVQLIAAVSILRTALTRMLPLAGCSAWWLTLLCLLPGLLLTALLNLAMRLARVRTLPELIRCCLGPMGRWLISLLLGLLLLLDGAASMTALITLFTEGVGTQGTQLTLAILTGGVLLFTLHREGLPRGVYLLRWVMLGAALAVAAVSLSALRTERLFPLMGDGRAALMTALRAGGSLSWPLALLLTVPAEKSQKHLSSAAACPVVLIVMAVLLFVTVTQPHELLIRHQGLADCLLLTAKHAPSAVRTLAQCLMMLAFFLAIGGAVQLGTDSLAAPMGEPPRWLSCIVLVALTATQALDTAALWRVMGLVEPWLLLPFAGLALLCLPIAAIRRKRT